MYVKGTISAWRSWRRDRRRQTAAPESVTSLRTLRGNVTWEGAAVSVNRAVRVRKNNILISKRYCVTIVSYTGHVQVLRLEHR